MERKEIDANTVVHRRQYDVTAIVMLNIGGLVFGAVAIRLFVICASIISDNIKDGKGFKASSLAPLIFGLILLAVSIGLLFWAWQYVYHWRKKRLALNYGQDGFATIIDVHKISEGSKSGANINLHYGFTLAYEEYGEQKTFKTDARFDVNEFNYLITLDQIKIKIYKNYVAINEEFRYGIYQRDPRTGLHKKYFTEKPFSTIYKLFQISTILSLAIFFIMFGLTIALKNNVFVFIGFGLIPLMTIPFAIAYAYYFFGGDSKKGKKK